MTAFEVTPGQLSDVNNPYMAVVMPDAKYGQIDDGYAVYNGKALITPPIEEIPEYCLEDICDNTGVEIELTHYTEKATIVKFIAEYAEDGDEDGDQEVVAAFTQLLNCLGRTATRL